MAVCVSFYTERHYMKVGLTVSTNGSILNQFGASFPRCIRMQSVSATTSQGAHLYEEHALSPHIYKWQSINHFWG